MGGYRLTPRVAELSPLERCSTLADALHNRLIGAPRAWINSGEGRRLIARGLRLIRKHEGRESAHTYRLSLIAAGAWPDCVLIP